MTPETADVVTRLAYLGIIGCVWIAVAAAFDWSQERKH